MPLDEERSEAMQDCHLLPLLPTSSMLPPLSLTPPPRRRS